MEVVKFELRTDSAQCALSALSAQRARSVQCDSVHSVAQSAHCAQNTLSAQSARTACTACKARDRESFEMRSKTLEKTRGLTCEALHLAMDAAFDCLVPEHLEVGQRTVSSCEGFGCRPRTAHALSGVGCEPTHFNRNRVLAQFISSSLLP